MTAAVTSSKSRFIYNSYQYDEAISNIPSSSSSSTNNNTFRTTSINYVNDPELFLGDDCDTYYQDTLVNSNLLQYLNSDIDGFEKSTTEIESLQIELFSTRARKRLEMLLIHIKDEKDCHQKGKGRAL